MLVHPRCVFVLAVDEEAGRPYIVMELMPGDTLKHLVEQEGPLPPEQAVAKILDVIEGLHEAHRQGVIHKAAQRAADVKDPLRRSEIVGVWAGCAFFSLLLLGMTVLGAFLFRGGWTLSVLGMTLVRANGRKAWRIQCAWRALLVWGPVAALVCLSAWPKCRS